MLPPIRLTLYHTILSKQWPTQSIRKKKYMGRKTRTDLGPKMLFQLSRKSLCNFLFPVKEFYKQMQLHRINWSLDKSSTLDRIAMSTNLVSEKIRTVSMDNKFSAKQN